MAASREEFEEWQALQVTQDMKKRVQQDVEILQDLLLEADKETFAGLQGRLKASYNFLDVSYEAIYGYTE